jgi:RNA polymerase sigma-70 factor (ECF subfamily)
VAPRSDPRPDVDLAAAAAAGERDALEALLARHVDRVYAVCRKICGPDDAQEATQDALVSVARSIHRFDGRAAFTTWLHRVATNAALDEVRRRKRRPEPLDPDGLRDLPVSTAAGGQPEQIVGRLDIDAALARLPADFRAAVILRDVADLDYSEIADTLSIPIGTVRSRIARGRAALARDLGNFQPAPDVQGLDHD